jgi:alpha-beta hydrolase superfamily lysophospholipase
MRTIKILSGIVSFLLALVSLVMVGLIALAVAAQYAARTPGAHATSPNLMLGSMTLAGWQIIALIGLLLTLAAAFIIGGIYGFRSPKTDA